MGDRPTTTRWSSRRLTRRRLVLAGAGLLLLTCRPNQPVPTPTSLPTVTPTVTPTSSAPVPTPKVTPTPRPTPTPRAIATPQFARIFIRQQLTEPRNHDFNADAACGGEPELFAGLVRLTPDYDVQPDWAERWDISADGTRWVFTLRRLSAGWSNSDPVRASDFVWSWQRMLDPAQPAPQSELLDVVGNARAVRQGLMPPEAVAVRALDDWTLEVELERPSGYFLWILGTPGFLPAHRPSVERWGNNWTEAGRCVSNGPFRLISWEHGSGYVLSSNPYYWNHRALTLDSCTVTVAQPKESLLPFFQGRVDFAAVPLELLPEVTSDESLLKRLQRSILPETWFLVVQPDVPPFDQEQLRRTVSRAIDRERLRQLLYGAVEPAVTLVPPGVPGVVPDTSLREMHRFAPLEVYQTWEPLRQRMTPTLRVAAPPSSSPVEEAVLRDVVAQLAANLGVGVEIERLEGQSWERVVTDGTFQLLWWRWPLPFPDAAAIYEWLFSRERKALRGLRWSSDELERFLALARGETELSRRLGAYRQCELVIQGESVVIPIVHPVATFLVQPWVVSLPRTRDGMLIGPGALFSRFLSSVVVRQRSG